MSEHYFVLNLTTERGDESFTCTGDNAELYRHKPQYREVDHVFVRIDENKQTFRWVCLAAYIGRRRV